MAGDGNGLQSEILRSPAASVITLLVVLAGIDKVMSAATLGRLLLPESYPRSGSGRADLRDEVSL
jgi:hypothetical protein